jgi:hypothetical protein
MLILPPESDIEIKRTPSDGSGVEEALDPIVGTESEISGIKRGPPDIEPSRADELEHREPIPGEQPFSENEESKSYSELGIKDDHPRRGSEERMGRRESLEDASIEEHASEQEDEAAETAQLSPTEEVRKALDRLEGRRQSRNESGPSRAIGGKGAALRERAKFKLYDQTERRRQTTKLSMPP